MKNKSFIWAWLAVFVFIFIYEWIFHGVLLGPLYEKTATLWRTGSEMINYFHWLVVGQFSLALFLCLLLQRMYRRNGFKEAVAIGLLLGMFLSAPNLIMYAVAPYPMTLVASWIVGGCVELMIASVVFAWIYNPLPVK